MVAPYRPTMVPSAPPRASMAPTLAKLDSLPRTQAAAGRPDYDLGHDYGYRQGVMHTLMAVTATLLLGCGVVAWLL